MPKPKRPVGRQRKGGAAPVAVDGEAHRRRGRARQTEARPVPSPANELEVVRDSLGPIKSQAGLDLTEKVKELLRLAQEQGHLTYDDLSDALPHNVATPQDLDHVLSKLRNLEIEIVDAAEVERGRHADHEEE